MIEMMIGISVGFVAAMWWCWAIVRSSAARERESTRRHLAFLHGKGQGR